MEIGKLVEELEKRGTLKHQIVKDEKSILHDYPKSYPRYSNENPNVPIIRIRSKRPQNPGYGGRESKVQKKNKGNGPIDIQTIPLPIKEISEPDIQRFLVEVERYGTDALAYYVNLHEDQNSWGIYITEWGAYYLAQEYLKPNPPIAETDPEFCHVLWLRLNVAAGLLFYHEFFHFLTELCGTSLETGNKPQPVAWIGMPHHSPPSSYAGYPFLLRYKYDVKRKLLGIHGSPHDHPLEEALANAFALRRTMNLSTTRKLNQFVPDAIGNLGDWMRNKQGSGYKDFNNYLDPQDFKAGTRKLVNTIRLGYYPDIADILEPLEILLNPSKSIVPYQDSDDHPPVYWVPYMGPFKKLPCGGLLGYFE